MVYDQVDNKGINDTVNRYETDQLDNLHRGMRRRWWDDLEMPVYAYSGKQRVEDVAKKLMSEKSKPLSFGEAFKAARKAGEKTFVWNGKTYGTKLKEEVEGDQKAEKSDTSKKDSKSELVSKRTPVIEVGEPVPENPWVVYAPQYPTGGNEPSYVAAKVYKNIVNEDGEVVQVVSNDWVGPYQYDLNGEKVNLDESRPWTLVGTHKTKKEKE